MKKKFYCLFLVSFFALFTFNSCQDDTVEINVPDEQETLIPNSVLTDLMLRTASNDGSLDNVLDSANCLSINLPVTIIANGITITINTLEDLELIEAVFEEFENDDDILEFLFPITIILNDYTEVNINNFDELETFIDECENVDDTDIECVDFQYPISFSLYDSNFQITETVVIESDEALYQFLEDLNNSDDGVVLASLNFPVTLVYANGETIVVNTHDELESAINSAEEDCENVDDDCNTEDVEMYLQECHWRIAAYNEDDVFENLYLFFNENDDLQILNGSTTQYIEGNWSTSLSNDGHVEIVISELNAFQEDLGGSWIVVECDDDRFELVRELEGAVTTMVIEQECEDDLECSAQEISMYLQECFWYAGTNLFVNIAAEEFHFGENNIVEVINSPTNQLTDTGAWEVTLSDQGVFVSLNFNLEPLNLFNRDWRVIECDEDRIKMVHGDDYIVFERDCNTNTYDCEDLQANFGDECESNGLVGFINENCECQVEDENPFDCFEDLTVTECDYEGNGFADFDLDAIFDCPEDNVSYQFFETLADAEAYVNPLLSPYTNIVASSQTIYVRVELAGTTNFEIFEVQLIVEDCSTTDCTEDNVYINLTECHWNIVNYNGSDDLIIYNFDFEANSGIVVIYTDNETIDAFWSTSQSEDGVIISFSNVAGANIQAITGDWLVVECTDDRLELVRENDFMVLERDCN
ncbi:hypothetical protein A9Q87_10825 [Flavobacteriales bacterium 34_180_T64]|nr:hypothetical protein A9Q87_10825 [Flavobacteriales bacterium 34_180_T64]